MITLLLISHGISLVSKIFIENFIESLVLSVCIFIIFILATGVITSEKNSLMLLRMITIAILPHFLMWLFIFIKRKFTYTL